MADNLHTCCMCHAGHLHVQLHHIDGNPENNQPENLAVLCLNCHSRVTSNEGLGKSYSPSEVYIQKERWEAHCKEASKSRAKQILIDSDLLNQAAKQFGHKDIGALYYNAELAKRVGATVGLVIEDYFGPYLFGKMIEKLEDAGELSRIRPQNMTEYDPSRLIYENVDATKIVFPKSVLQTTVPDLRELAVWVAAPNSEILRGRTQDRYDFAGTFLYLVTPLYDSAGGQTFFSGCSALQVISNMIHGKPLLTRDWDEPLGRASHLHPIEKLKSLGGIPVDRRPIQTLYKCRYFSDEQCFIDGDRTYRGHDLLAYPLFIGNDIVRLMGTHKNTNKSKVD